MKTQKQIEAWLRIKIKNLQYVLGSNIGKSRVGLKRMATRLHKLVDQLDIYLQEREIERRKNENKRNYS